LLKKIFGNSEPVFSIHRGFVVLPTRPSLVFSIHHGFVVLPTQPSLFLSSLFLRLVVLLLVVCVVVLLVFLLSLLVVAQQTPCCLLKLWLLQTTRKGLHRPPLPFKV
jgi:hypothetical protein